METGNKPLWCRRHPFLSLAVVVALLAVGLVSMDAHVAVGAGNLVPLNTVPVPTRTGGDIADNAAPSVSARRCSGISRPGATARSRAPRVTSTPAPTIALSTRSTLVPMGSSTAAV